MITQTQLIARRLATATTNTTEFIIGDLIKSHDTRAMEDGVNYYHNRNQIKDRKLFFFDDKGRRVLDEAAINNRVPHNWHKLMVDQKVAYLLGRPPVLSADPDAYAEALNDWLDEEWDDALQELGKGASNKGREYIHPYIDEEGQFRYAVIPAEQVIPVYDSDYQREIVQLIRYYPYWINGRETIRAEWWSDQTVEFFVQIDGIFEREALEGRQNPEPHFFHGGKGYGWGRVPFVEFRNNRERETDLTYYRELIDVYDLVVSDLANDLESLQKLIYVLRGYDGTSMREFVENLRHFKAVKVAGEGSGVDILQAQIPVEAVDMFLRRQEENIFLFGQGVNAKTDRFGASPSGIALKFLYTLLDLKADILARGFAFAIKGFCWFLTEYMSLSGDYVAPKKAVDSIRVTFSKSMLVNDLELVEIAAKSKTIISDETILANHPWVEDASAEKERMEEDQGVSLMEPEEDRGADLMEPDDDRQPDRS